MLGFDSSGSGNSTLKYKYYLQQQYTSTTCNITITTTCNTSVSSDATPDEEKIGLFTREILAPRYMSHHSRPNNGLDVADLEEDELEEGDGMVIVTLEVKMENNSRKLQLIWDVIIFHAKSEWVASRV
jgi:hypothetical protein